MKEIHLRMKQAVKFGLTNIYLKVSKTFEQNINVYRPRGQRERQNDG